MLRLATFAVCILFCLAVLGDESHSELPRGLDLPAGRLVETVASGDWSDAGTWGESGPPRPGDRVLVREGHRVRYDVVSPDVLRAVFVSGTLSFAHDRDTELNVGLLRIQPGNDTTLEGFDCDHLPDKGAAAAFAKEAGQPGFSAICVCCRSKSALLVGTPERPIDADHTATIRLHHVAGMDPKSLPAIVCCGGRMDFHGAPLSRTWVKLGGNVHSGRRKGSTADEHVVLAEPVEGWRVGDEIIVTTTGSYRQQFEPRTEARTITALDGRRITVDEPFEHDHTGEGEYRGEVANLSRNVVVESAAPDGVRGHTMYHVGSAGSISYAEFRHLGKRGVLGRYSLHYHLVGDTMRGSSVVGASIHDSHNRWITVHGTQYLVVRDCVGFKSVGHGFFLEDGTEVYNVFDRNLAVQAAVGRPLPKQVFPFDANDGAGFWWANSRNTFTNNVSVENGRYGFRYDATPRAGVVNRKLGLSHGDPGSPFDLELPVLQPDGTTRKVDIRTLPFVRFENNEAHSTGRWGVNLGQGVAGVGPDPSTPFVLRNTKVWGLVGGWAVEAPHVLLDGMVVADVGYGIRDAKFIGHDYRNVAIQLRKYGWVRNRDEYLAFEGAPSGINRARQPGWPAGDGDGGARHQPAEIEVAELNPIDRLPPITVITSVRRTDEGTLLVRGTTTDDGEVVSVRVNAVNAKPTSANFATWEAALPEADEVVALLARSTDDAGNEESTPHEMLVAVD